VASYHRVCCCEEGISEGICCEYIFEENYGWRRVNCFDGLTAEECRALGITPYELWHYYKSGYPDGCDAYDLDEVCPDYPGWTVCGLCDSIQPIPAITVTISGISLCDYTPYGCLPGDDACVLIRQIKADAMNQLNSAHACTIYSPGNPCKYAKQWSKYYSYGTASFTINYTVQGWLGSTQISVGASADHFVGGHNFYRMIEPEEVCTGGSMPAHMWWECPTSGPLYYYTLYLSEDGMASILV
jgi:hypothetical protein